MPIVRAAAPYMEETVDKILKSAYSISVEAIMKGLERKSSLFSD